MTETSNKGLLDKLIQLNLDAPTRDWLREKIKEITGKNEVRDMYLTYSMLARKVNNDKLSGLDDSAEGKYLALRGATILEISRIYLLTELLRADREVFLPKVKKIIAVADSKELETFLKYLILLPEAGDYKTVAVDALRTNIASVFDALALYNPYPAQYFNDAQWNQMYLKAAFMQRPLEKIPHVEERANADLARIISDYAHERWAARRDIDPYFWRPVAPFMNEVLLEDMKHLFETGDEVRQKTAALCCAASDSNGAKKLLENHPKLQKMITENQLDWTTIYQ